MPEAQGTAPSSVALLTELPEAQATGEVRRIYAEIRHWGGVPMVALIYRHLATLPGALEWAWEVVGPPMRAGLLQQTAWALAAEATVPARARVTRAALRAAGLDAAAEAAIGAVLDAYNRANPINILALRCLAQALAQPAVAAGDAPPRPDWAPPAAPAPLRAMVDPQAMDPAVRALVLLLTDRDDGRPASPLWPSLYRHLAPWPAMLGYASVLVLPEFPALDAAAARLRSGIDAAAIDLARRVPPPRGLAAPGAEVREPLHAALESFGTRIPEMVVIGGLLRRALPAT